VVIRHVDPSSENVGFLPPISGRFDRFRRPRPHSAKTYGNLVQETACRNTYEFPVPVAAALIGHFLNHVAGTNCA